jgi:hypothetical protein
MKKIFIFLSLSLLIFSCADFLDEEPRSSITTGQYFVKPQHAQSVVNSLYRIGAPTFQHASGAYSGSKAMIGGYLSNFFENSYKGQEIFVNYAQTLTMDPVNFSGTIDGIWNDCYAAIGRANTAIKYIPNTANMTDAEKNRLLAEAKFFRAYNYFWLVKFFGKVPMITEPYESLNELYVKRAEIKQVYDQIVKDLKEASEQGGLANKPMPENGFRVSKGSIDILLADVYLTMSGFPLNENRYADAATTAKSIINSGSYSLIQHGATPETSAYNVMRTSDNTKEYLYVYEYTAGISDASWLPIYCYPVEAQGWGIFKYSITNNAYQPLPHLLAIYQSDDYRIQEKQFFHTTLTRNNQTWTYPHSPYLWHNDNALFEVGSAGAVKDITVYRYAEALLIAAEAIAKSGGSIDEAAGYLAQVRQRAFPAKTVAEVKAELTGLAADAFVKEVWKERMREFPLEFKIWADIQRTRQIAVTSASNPGTVNYVNVIGYTNVWGATYQEKNLLFPLSSNEINRNPELEQNPF